MKREVAMTYVGQHCVDDTGAARKLSEMPNPSDKVRLVGWQCGFEPMFVAVWSYLDVRLDDDTAEELATDLLLEKKWFTDGVATEPDYIL